VVSGYDGDAVFYQKTLLDEGDFKVLDIEYDRGSQPWFDSVVSKIADSFMATK
jgi:hypothetical protein